ncbi:MAG: FG-GAP-like repeat-containing protein, partial [Phycisphaerales bacterium]|nr:FG-GAP-like repeat-containing protein [Phycisphaerales bacterium]
MTTSTIARLIVGAFALLAAASLAAAGTLNVLSVGPSANSLTNSINSSISIDFDQPVNPATVTAASFRAFGRWSGLVEGTFNFTNGDQTVTLSPDAPFSAGESVMVFLSHDVQAVDGSPLRAAGYSFRFWTKTRPACFIYQELDVMSTQSDPPAQTRIYGALGSDLNNDGWLDLVTINEVSADLRVFMNTADGSGLFFPWLEPPEPALEEISPNEPADFNNDGFADVGICSNSTDRVLIFLGNGDGTYQPAQIIIVGDQPRGIAVLDVEGDGDPDIVNGNLGSSNLSLLLNNGAGVFGAPAFFEGGVGGEYGIAAADMDTDGIMDLVVGGNGSQQIAVRHGNGNGTFSPLSVQASGGPVWQIGTGDVSGDGLEDVHTANSFNDSGSI